MEEEMKVPLLEPRPPQPPPAAAPAADDEGMNGTVAGKEEEEEVGLGRRLVEENRKLWVVAGPSIFTRFSTFGLTVISQAFVGHIGATELAAYALVSTVLMRFSNGILLGMASALETLCGQSYGAKQYHMMGIYLQRSWLILCACAVCILPIYIFTEPLLVFLGQDPKIAAVAGTISLWYILVMFSYVASFPLQMYLQAQSKNMIITYLAFLNLGIHLILSWLFTAKYHLGLAGVMGSMVIAMWIPVFGELAFVFFGGCPLTWTGFSSVALTDLVPILKLSLSSGVMLAAGGTRRRMGRRRRAGPLRLLRARRPAHHRIAGRALPLLPRLPPSVHVDRALSVVGSHHPPPPPPPPSSGVREAAERESE